jgi:hypothetical protein
MSAAGEAKAKEYTRASGAKPRPEGRVREHGWRPTAQPVEFAEPVKQAARRRTSDPADGVPVTSLPAMRRPGV